MENNSGVRGKGCDKGNGGGGGWGCASASYINPIYSQPAVKEIP